MYYVSVENDVEILLMRIIPRYFTDEQWKSLNSCVPFITGIRKRDMLHN